MVSFGPFFSPWAFSPHLFSLGILGLFSNSAFSWAFTNFFEIPCHNYHILHPWDLWAFHQPLTFLLYYFGPVVAHSYFSTSHNAHRFTTSSSRGSLRPIFFSQSPFIYFIGGLMIHYSYYLGLMVFFFSQSSYFFSVYIVGLLPAIGLLQNGHQQV